VQSTGLNTSVRIKFKVGKQLQDLPSPLYRRTNKGIDGKSIETPVLVDSDTQ